MTCDVSHAAALFVCLGALACRGEPVDAGQSATSDGGTAGGGHSGGGNAGAAGASVSDGGAGAGGSGSPQPLPQCTQASDCDAGVTLCGPDNQLKSYPPVCTPDGTCAVDLAFSPCDAGTLCHHGACAPTDDAGLPVAACVSATDCDLPVSECIDAATLRFFKSPTCVAGTCGWTVATVDCGKDAVCHNGGCLAPPTN